MLTGLDFSVFAAWWGASPSKFLKAHRSVSRNARAGVGTVLHGKNADIFRNDLSCSTSSLAYQSRNQLVSRKDLSVEMQPIKQVQERFCGQSQR